jgi:hypothetical protein
VGSVGSSLSHLAELSTWKLCPRWPRLVSGADGENAPRIIDEYEYHQIPFPSFLRQCACILSELTVLRPVSAGLFKVQVIFRGNFSARMPLRGSRQPIKFQRHTKKSFVWEIEEHCFPVDVAVLICILICARLNRRGFPVMSTCKRWDCHKSPFILVERKIQDKYTWTAHLRLNRQGASCKLNLLQHSKLQVRRFEAS